MDAMGVGALVSQNLYMTYIYIYIYIRIVHIPIV